MSDHDDERVQQVIDELDPTPASESAWPVSRRQTLRALAAAGLIGAGSASASAESAGTVIADEAVFSNYGSESVSDGWELTIDDDVFALTESEDTIGLPDGGVGEEVVLPNGAEALEMIAPDGTVVFDSVDIPDSVVEQMTNWWRFSEGEGTTVSDSEGSLNANFTGLTWDDSAGLDGWNVNLNGTDEYGDLGSDSRQQFTHFTENGVGTVFAWIYPEISEGMVIFGSSSSFTNVAVYFAVQDDNGDLNLRFDFSDGDNRMAFAAGGDIPRNTWTPVAGVADGTEATIYIGEDMANVGSGEISDGTTDDLDDNVNIGRRSDSDGNHWEGSLDNIWISDQEVSQSDLQEFVDATKAEYS